MTRSGASLLLGLAAMAWGLGNVVQKAVLELDPFSSVGLRCLIRELLALPLALREEIFATGSRERRSLFRPSGLFALAMLLRPATFPDTNLTNAGLPVSPYAVMMPLVA